MKLFKKTFPIVLIFLVIMSLSILFFGCLSKTTYKKFNSNTTPQRNWWDIEQPPEPIKPFPSYEEWKSMIESGTLPSEFDMRPTEKETK